MFHMLGLQPRSGVVLKCDWVFVPWELIDGLSPSAW